MVGIIVNITIDVPKGLKEQIKLFGQMGTPRSVPRVENVERIVLDYTNICDTLDQQKMLPDNSIQDTIQGLPLSSYVKGL